MAFFKLHLIFYISIISTDIDINKEKLNTLHQEVEENDFLIIKQEHLNVDRIYVKLYSCIDKYYRFFWKTKSIILTVNSVLAINKLYNSFTS